MGEINSNGLNDLVPRSWQTWGHFGGRPTAVSETGLSVFEWALKVHEEFYGDDWFARAIDAHEMPLMNVWVWPHSNPLAVIVLLERAARIALLSEDVREQASSKVCYLTTIEDFYHFDLMLETAGFAIRSGWQVDFERSLESSTRIPDIELTKPGNVKTVIEVTTRGMSRAVRRNDRWVDNIREHFWQIESNYQVQIEGNITRELDERELEVLLGSLQSAALEVQRSRVPGSVAILDAELTLHPAGTHPNPVNVEFPATYEADAWQTIHRRLVDKAKQTTGAYNAWILLEEGSGLFMFTPLANMSPEQQLGEISKAVWHSLAQYPHIRGVILSIGIGFDLQDGKEQYTIWKVRQDNLGTLQIPIDIGQLPATLERVFPGYRRRRTFIIPVNKPKLLVPKWHNLYPYDWYSSEGSWLDWALFHLGKPPLSEIIVQN